MGEALAKDQGAAVSVSVGAVGSESRFRWRKTWKRSLIAIFLVVLVSYQPRFLQSSLPGSLLGTVQETQVNGKTGTTNVSMTGYDAEPLALFYNIYIPTHNIDNGIRIVQEQLQMRAASEGVSTAPLYYTFIGAIHNTTLPECHNCYPIQKVEQGDEVLTLQAMWEYCNASEVAGNNKEDGSRQEPRLVVYIHNKGSSTMSQNNEILRRTLTKAAFSTECTNLTGVSNHGDTTQRCDVCSAQFSILPVPQVVGNMFVADCDYVSRLIQPKDFAQAKKMLMEGVWQSNVSQLLGLNEEHPDLYWQVQRPSWVGVDRYAMEHWIHSHPSVQPCDVFRVSFDYKHPLVRWRQVTPQRKAAPSAILRDKTRSKVQTRNFHPWFLLPGRLYEYQALYHELPSTDGTGPTNQSTTSWVYQSYPPVS